MLHEDWGTVDVQLAGQDLDDGSISVRSIQVASVIPAAEIVSDFGAVRMTRTVYRAPVHPAGVDVMSIQLQETRNQARDITVRIAPSVGLKLGARTARIGARTALVLPQAVLDNAPLLDWGYCDEASSLPGWAKPHGTCDSAFRNIRAGMGGVPIAYRFAVTPRAEREVVLGFCESHWAESGKRPLLCQIEGAEAVIVDPVAEWGQHQPGLLTFRASDRNGDGQLDLSVRSARQASDHNPILNAIWVFAPGAMPPADQVLAGTGNAAALYYVDVGGTRDQSIYQAARLEMPVHLEAGQLVQFELLVACPGGSAPQPTTSTWNSRTLQRAARDVWRDWQATR
jgi:hypothetical protein